MVPSLLPPVVQFLEWAIQEFLSKTCTDSMRNERSLPSTPLLQIGASFLSQVLAHVSPRVTSELGWGPPGWASHEWH